MLRSCSLGMTTLGRASVNSWYEHSPSRQELWRHRLSGSARRNAGLKASATKARQIPQGPARAAGALGYNLPLRIMNYVTLLGMTTRLF
jgi:hypothetical protein